MLRQALPRISYPARLVRFASSSPRSTLTPTTFSEKSSPRNVHDRPEEIRGFPPKASGPQWNKPEPASTPEASEAFDGPSRPRLVYARGPRKELPDFTNRTRLYVVAGVTVLAAWGLFLLYATNAERLASSVMRSLQFHLRNSQEVKSALGTRVKLEEPWYVLGDPWISGNVNTMQGRVDLKFRVKGDQGKIDDFRAKADSGTIYFTSIRPSQHDPWRIVRYKLITDSGETLRLEDKIDKV